MSLIIGIFIIAVGLLCWIGQSLVFITPHAAEKLGLVEPKDDMDEGFYIIEAKSIALNDLLLTWTLPLSGLLMILENPLWPYFGLIGGGIYLYFSGYIILSRIFLNKNNKKIGSSSSVTTAYIFGVIWTLSALLMIGLSYQKLSV